MKCRGSSKENSDKRKENVTHLTHAVTVNEKDLLDYEVHEHKKTNLSLPQILVFFT